MQIFEKLCEIIKEYLYIEDTVTLTRESTLLELGADSLDVAEIVMNIEDTFDITVPEGAEDNIHTVGDVEKLIARLLEES